MINIIDQPNQIADQFKDFVESSWEGGIDFKNMQGLDLNEPVNLLLTLCPMYAKGDLSSSQLMSGQFEINESRVAGKFEGVETIVKSIQNFLTQNATGIGSVKIVFANKGVLLSGDSAGQDSILKLHAAKYLEEIQSCFGDLPFEFMSFNSGEVDVKFPDFVNPNEPLPKTSAIIDESMTIQFSLIEILNAYFMEMDTNVSIKNNNDSRRVIKDLVKSFGTNTTFWMVAGYLAFDYKIPGLMGDNGIYLSTERMDPIFRIAKLTEPLAKLPRIEIKC